MVGFLDRRGGYVDELAVFDDKSKQRFFLRCIFHGVAAQPLELDALKRDFADIAARFDMSWQVYDLTRRPRWSSWCRSWTTAWRTCCSAGA